LQYFFFIIVVDLDVAVLKSFHIARGYRFHSRPECVYRCFAISNRDGSGIISLLRLPDVLALMLIEFIFQSETCFDHQFVEMTPKFIG
jgi:hypothetical protein